MSIQMALRGLRGRVLGHYSRPLPEAFSAPLAGGRGLEIGGPSAVFADGGLLPVYGRLTEVDGVQPTADTHWHTLDAADGYVVDGRRRGELVLSGDVDLDGLEDDRYDVVLSSHVLEHIANPLRALAAWRRVTRPGGHVLIVVPHLEGTFDHRRPVTELAHIVADFDAGVAEDDLTHVEEFVALHDSARNEPWTAGPEFEPRMRDNVNTRLMHHHTFTTLSLAAVLSRAGLDVLAAETRLPHDIYMLGRWRAADGAAGASGASGESGAPAEPARAAARRSPFRRDRARGRAGRA